MGQEYRENFNIERGMGRGLGLIPRFISWLKVCNTWVKGSGEIKLEDFGGDTRVLEGVLWLGWGGWPLQNC